MAPAGLRLRWSLRDLRARWLQVAAIAVVIALGTGAYVGLSSGSAWRRDALVDSYEALQVHDLLVELAEGTTVDADRLRAALAGTPHPEWVEASTVRLEVPVQVEADTGSGVVLVPGRVVGVELDDGTGPAVDALHLRRGRLLGPADEGRPVVVLDDHFAEEHGLTGEGSLRLSGGVEVRSVGSAWSPQYFIVSGGEGVTGFLGASGFAVMWTSLPTAQELAGLPGQADQAGVRLADGVDVAAARAELEATLAAALPEAAVTVVELTEEPEYRRLFDDVDGDQQMFDVFAVLVLAGAAFAAFNLVGRVVESQRREIGIGMSLGVPRRALAVRPLLFALEVSLLGVVFGVAVGAWFGSTMAGLVEELLPTPVWDTPFQPGIYARGVLLALGLTFVAAAWPVWRALRVDPVEAIQTGPRTTGGGGLAHLASRLPVPGGSLGRMPVRDVLRRPRRTLLTALAVAVAVALLVAVLGMLDSFYRSIDDAEAETLQGAPERLTVTFDGFTLDGGPVTEALAAVPEVGAAEPFLRLGAELRPPADAADGPGSTAASDGSDGSDDGFAVLVDLVPVDSAIWVPTLVEGSFGGDGPGLVVTRKAADDLGVDVGEPVVLHHPVREGAGYRWVDTPVPVTGIHAGLFRGAAYMDRADASLMALAGVVNVAQVEPADGVTTLAVQEALFDTPGMASAVPVGTTIEVIRDTFAQLLGVLRLVEVVALVLAVLIAFNSSSISSDERAREHATMVAFGVPPRTVVGLGMVESALVGVVATLLGLALGAALLGWLVHVLIPTTLPDVQLLLTVSPTTYVTAAAMGVVAVGLAPLLTLRRVRRMSVPDTLRAVE